MIKQVHTSLTNLAYPFVHQKLKTDLIANFITHLGTKPEQIKEKTFKEVHVQRRKKKRTKRTKTDKKHRHQFQLKLDLYHV